MPNRIIVAKQNTYPINAQFSEVMWWEINEYVQSNDDITNKTLCADYVCNISVNHKHFFEDMQKPELSGLLKNPAPDSVYLRNLDENTNE